MLALESDYFPSRTAVVGGMIGTNTDNGQTGLTTGILAMSINMILRPRMFGYPVFPSRGIGSSGFGPLSGSIYDYNTSDPTNTSGAYVGFVTAT